MRIHVHFFIAESRNIWAQEPISPLGTALLSSLEWTRKNNPPIPVRAKPGCNDKSEMKGIKQDAKRIKMKGVALRGWTWVIEHLERDGRCDIIQ